MSFKNGEFFTQEPKLPANEIDEVSKPIQRSPFPEPKAPNAWMRFARFFGGYKQAPSIKAVVKIGVRSDPVANLPQTAVTDRGGSSGAASGSDASAGERPASETAKPATGDTPVQETQTPEETGKPAESGTSAESGAPAESGTSAAGETPAEDEKSEETAESSSGETGGEPAGDGEPEEDDKTGVTP